MAKVSAASAARVWAAAAVLIVLTHAPRAGAGVTGRGRDGAIARALDHIAAAPDVFFAGPFDELTVRDVILDPGGAAHVRFERRHRTLRVIGGDLVVHSDGQGQLAGVSQELRAFLDVSPTATVSEAAALAAAELAFEGAREGTAQAARVVYARDGAALLAYEIVLRGVRPDRTPSALHVFVDAHSGAVLDRWDTVQTSGGAPASCTGDCDGCGSVQIAELVRGVAIALGEQLLAVCPAFDCQHTGSVGITCLVQAVGYALSECPSAPPPTATATIPSSTPTATPDTAAANAHGFFYDPVSLATSATSSGFALTDPSRGEQYTTDMDNRANGEGALFTDSDDVWGDGSLSDRQSVGVDAQYGMAQTWDYFALVHGRLGIAGDGVGAFNRVHFNTDYDNAFWDDDCFCMTYGDGDGETFYPFVSLDVAAHEMTHGVTSHTADLVYSGEAGGLNEATSDIFGTAVEFTAANPNDPPDYLIGEKIYIQAGQALRYMYRPSEDGRSADCWSPTVRLLNVHYSSGVANHFFYLLAEGSGVGPYTDDVGSPTCNDGIVVGIGLEAAARVWYRALTVYMTSTTTYAGARAATLRAAADLFGSDSAERAAVAAAWSAVRVD